MATINLDRVECNSGFVNGYSVEEQDKALAILNGVIIAMNNDGFGWMEGWRNTMAVDFTIAAEILGQDAERLFNVYFDPGLSNESRYDAIERIRTVASYNYANNNDSFDMMLDPDEWIRWSQNGTPRIAFSN